MAAPSRRPDRHPARRPPAGPLVPRRAAPDDGPDAPAARHAGLAPHRPHHPAAAMALDAAPASRADRSTGAATTCSNPAAAALRAPRSAPRARPPAPQAPPDTPAPTGAARPDPHRAVAAAPSCRQSTEPHPARPPCSGGLNAYRRGTPRLSDTETVGAARTDHRIVVESRR